MPTVTPQTGQVLGMEAGLPDIQPTSGAVLASLEARRRDGLMKGDGAGKCRAGCDEVDEAVLEGGLERGSVVGISAGEDFGVLLAVQIIARELVHGATGAKSGRAMVISTQPTATVVRTLRDAVVTQLEGVAEGGRERVREVLGLVSIVRVFDIKGLWEVLEDMDREAATEPEKREESPDTSGNEQQELAGGEGRVVREEIPDSDEEASLSPSPSPPTTTRPTIPAQEPQVQVGSRGQMPDIILITHFTTLLTTLFTHTENRTAHTALQLLSSRLRSLTRSPASPLVLISNSIATSSTSAEGPPPHGLSRPGPPGYDSAPRRPDPTLRSVFDGPGPYGGGAPGSSSSKPSFGTVFTQFLDLHLLCSRVPRTRGDAEAVATGVRGPREVWVVEVLLDEMGVWEGRMGERRVRDRRWGVVDWVGGRVVDAFGDTR